MFYVYNSHVCSESANYAMIGECEQWGMYKWALVRWGIVPPCSRKIWGRTAKKFGQDRQPYGQDFNPGRHV